MVEVGCDHHACLHIPAFRLTDTSEEVLTLALRLPRNLDKERRGLRDKKTLYQLGVRLSDDPQTNPSAG
jgi:hypothetical protein